MDVVDLLPNHPCAPERYRFETLLPDMKRAFGILLEIDAVCCLDNVFGLETFELSGEFLDPSVFWINNQMSVIRHQHICD